MGKLKSLHDEIVADDPIPRRLAHGSVFVQRFVDYVPSADPSLVASDHRLDVIMHAFEQCIAGERLALSVFKDPPRSLAMPDEAMAHDEHFVFLAKGHILVGLVEIVSVWAGMDRLPFERVLGADCIELRLDDRIGYRIAVLELCCIQRRSNSK